MPVKVPNEDKNERAIERAALPRKREARAYAAETKSATMQTKPSAQATERNLALPRM